MQHSHTLVATSISKGVSDSELIQRTRVGESVAFEAIMRRYNRLLFRIARSILKSDAEAEDALQEAYLHAWRAIGSFHSNGKLSTWLVRIVVNEANGRLRRNNTRVIPLGDGMNSFEEEMETSLTGDPADFLEQSTMRGQLRKLIEARIDLLPSAFRTVFMLRAIEEMSVGEVAQTLDIPEATVRSRFFRARSLMREGLASDIEITLGDAFGFGGLRCDRVVEAVLARLKYA